MINKKTKNQMIFFLCNFKFNFLKVASTKTLKIKFEKQKLLLHVNIFF